MILVKLFVSLEAKNDKRNLASFLRMFECC